MPPIRTLLVDDHALIRQGIRALLHDTEVIDVVGEASDGRQAVAMTERLVPDVVLMDLLMPVMDGAQATAAIVGRNAEIGILALSGSEIESKIFAALGAGARGYVSKAASRQELVTAIQRVHAGQLSMPADLTRSLLDHYTPGGPRPEALTPRETEIVRWVAQGLTNQQIAERAFLSQATVRTHLTNIFGKLRISNRVEATLFALRDGLATLDECLQGR